MKKQILQLNPRFTLLLISASLTLSLGGCAVREQFFGCEGLTPDTLPDEFVMTPTSLRFQSTDYRFKEEQKAQRIYIQAETGRIIQFNTASGVLQRDSSQWQCTRIGVHTQ